MTRRPNRATIIGGPALRWPVGGVAVVAAGTAIERTVGGTGRGDTVAAVAGAVQAAIPAVVIAVATTVATATAPLAAA